MSLRTFLTLAFAVAPLSCSRSEAKELAKGRAVSATARASATALGAPPTARAQTAPSASPEKSAQRVHAKTRFVWVRIEPDTASAWIGYLWLGGSAKLKTGKVRWGPGCTYWYEIEPRGFVCVDGRDATLNGDDPVLKALLPYAPKVDSAWPHHYGESRGLARYGSIPTLEQQRRREWDLTDHLARVGQAQQGQVHESLKGVDVTPATGTPLDLSLAPPTLHEHRPRMTPLSTIAHSHEVFDGNRSWLLTGDFMWVPKDRVAPYPHVDFHGVRLGKDAKLPLAFFRGEDRPKYRRDAAGDPVATDQKWQRLGFVELTGASFDHSGDTYLETRDSGFWVKRRDAVVPTPQARTPWGAPVGGEDIAAAPRGRRTWLEASNWKGWLIAYEGTKPVYATLISPGRGGSPEPGKDPLTTASTPIGQFKISGKFRTATMEAPGEFIHSDVPWTQNFHGPHALHAAYWHDDWGNRKSAGCVNVSPIDGKWLFEFTEPDVPEGWHGVRWRPEAEPATTFVIHD